MKILKQYIREILQEEIGRNYHTIDPDPNTWDSFQDFEIEYYPQEDGSYLLDLSFKGKPLIKTARFSSQTDAKSFARQTIDKCRVEYMNATEKNVT